jgi:hypothetical protein
MVESGTSSIQAAEKWGLVKVFPVLYTLSKSKTGQ